MRGGTMTPPRLVYCTGIAASWCPLCGDCVCPRAESGDRLERGDAACPLHREGSTHGDSRPPSIEEMIQLGLDSAEDQGAYSRPLRTRIARVEVLPRLRLADLWTAGGTLLQPDGTLTRWWVGSGYKAAEVVWDEGAEGWVALVRRTDSEGHSTHDRLGPYKGLAGRHECCDAADLRLREEGFVL